MRGGEGIWQEVRRRKNVAKAIDFHEATSYYVSGMSSGATKADIRKCFSGFGDLVDIFMGKKKDAAGKNFAFVKFYKVEDIWELERNMQNVTCASKPLAVNVARYNRSKTPIIETAPLKTTTSHLPRHPSKTPPSYHSDGGKDRRSYVAVATGASNPMSLPLSPPIILNPQNSTRNWLTDKVLVGETLSIDHLASLHSGLHGDDTLENIKYIGGLNVALCFKDQSNAARFMLDSGRWIEWLQWVVPGNSRDFCDDRIAWVNITGLPMRLWSDENVTSIVKNFGKIIVPADEMGAKVDESILKVGILTKLKKWINAEIAVTDGGKHFNVGLVEFEKNWTPFPNSPFVDTDSSDDEEGGDDDGISDTDMALEDGEIPPETDKDDNTDMALEDGEIPMPMSNDDDAACCANSKMENKETSAFNLNNYCSGSAWDEILNEKEPVGSTFPINDEDAARDVNSKMENKGTATFNLNNNCYGSTLDDILNENEQVGSTFPSFGPFPSSLPPLPPTPPSQPNSIDKGGQPKFSDSWIKRRKLCRSDHRPSPYRVDIPISKQKETHNNDPPAANPFDLNREPSTTAPVVFEPPLEDCCSSSSEIGKTVAVGIEVGFLINHEDPLLAEIVGENGEIVGHI